jgi:hypothetical protein
MASGANETIENTHYHRLGSSIRTQILNPHHPDAFVALALCKRIAISVSPLCHLFTVKYDKRQDRCVVACIQARTQRRAVYTLVTYPLVTLSRVLG